MRKYANKWYQYCVKEPKANKSANLMFENAKKLRIKNIKFLKTISPQLAEVAEKSQLNKVKVNILTERNETNLIINEKNLYRQSAEYYSKREVARFLESNDINAPIESVHPCFSETYSVPRPYQQKLASCIAESPLQRNNYSGLKLMNSFPLITFVGIGSGCHIDEITKLRRVDNAIFFEPQFEKFLASLYIVDWKKICKRIQRTKANTVQFIVGDIHNIDQQHAHIWNSLARYTPLFPVSAIFYNHLATKENEKLIAGIRKDLVMHLSQWGHWDDEINQINNAIHNFKQQVKQLEKPTGERFKVPVFVIGSGPSLGEYINEIKDNQDKSVIISCGSALNILHKHNITPDFQIELESDYITCKFYEDINDSNYLNKITLIGSVQLNPHVYGFFEKKAIFFKDSIALSQYYDLNQNIILGCTPTCTNSGLAISLHYGADNIFLFGMDFGFSDINKKHTDGSYYDNKNMPKVLDESIKLQDRTAFREKSYKDEDMLTLPFYFTAKRRVEIELKRNKYKKENISNVYHCSKGLKIDFIDQHLEPNQLSVIIKSIEQDDKSKYINSIVNSKSINIGKDELKQYAKKMENDAVEISNILIKEVKKRNSDPESIIETITSINHLLETYISKNYGSIYYLFRGTVWHYLFFGFTHLLSLKKDSDNQIKLAKQWKVDFINLLEFIPDNLKEVLERDIALDKDKMTTTNINNPL